MNSRTVKTVLMALSMLLPWRIRRGYLIWAFGYDIHPTSTIGLAWIFPSRLILEANTRIGHFTVCRKIALLHLQDSASIGQGNWISGSPLDSSVHFAHETSRRPELILGPHAAVTHLHLLDCTNRISIGEFTTLAGYRSQMLTHSIDLARNRQVSKPIDIGGYCFIGTSCVVLGGSVLPHHCVLGAGALMSAAFDEPYYLYGGVPARRLRPLSADDAYFVRETGFVV